MLVTVQCVQVSRGQTTYENMRGAAQHRHHGAGEVAGIVANAIAAGGASGGGMEGVSGASPSNHTHSHKSSDNSKCWTRTTKLLGVDTFVHTAQDGIEASGGVVGRSGARGSAGGRGKRRNSNKNPWSRGCLTNCSDFWSSNNGGREKGVAVLGGERVDYFSLYEIPRRGDVEMVMGGGGRRAGYRGVAADEGEEGV